MSMPTSRLFFKKKMGVPKFFRWISERYPCLSQIVKEHQIPEFDNMYLDMNGIIHTCSHPDDSDVQQNFTEKEIFVNIAKYIDYLFQLIKPRKLFFMAVDGVAPRAKMNQQRGRRFRTAREAAALRNEAIKRGESVPENKFDSNCITPGTDFMVKLHEFLQKYIAYKVSSDENWKVPVVIYSGHNVPGEGEHKIMEYIRYFRAKEPQEANLSHVIHGLDADLIMLSLSSHEPNFCLLREEVKFTKQQQKRSFGPQDTTFYLLHIRLLREYIDLEFSSLKKRLSFPYDLERIIDDWILLGFLVGNDFVPHLAQFHINEDALPKLWQTYKRMMPSATDYLTCRGMINLPMFEQYCGLLAVIDRKIFRNRNEGMKFLENKDSFGEVANSTSKATPQPAFSAQQTAVMRELTSFAFSENEDDDENAVDGIVSASDADDEASAVETHDVRQEFDVDFEASDDENFDFYKEELAGDKKPKRRGRNKQKTDEYSYDKRTNVATVPGRPMSDTDEDPNVSNIGENRADHRRWLKVEFRNFKNSYYKSKLNIEKVDEAFIRQQTIDYVKAMQWILNYYYHGVPSWSWYYPHHYAPFLSDLRGFANVDIKFELCAPFKPFEQLMSVLPAASSKFLPEPLRYLMSDPQSPIIDYYPVDFESDLNGKAQEWEAVVLIPFIDEKRLLSALTPQYTKLTKKQRDQNSFGQCYRFRFSAAKTKDKTLSRFETDDVELVPRVPIKIACDALNPCYFDIPPDSLYFGINPKFVALRSCFPTFSDIPYTHGLHKLGVKVFQQKSRGSTMVLKILNKKDIFQQDPGLEFDKNVVTNCNLPSVEKAKSLVNSVVMCCWPYRVRGRVQKVTCFWGHNDSCQKASFDDLLASGKKPTTSLDLPPEFVFEWDESSKKVIEKKLGDDERTDHTKHVDMLREQMLFRRGIDAIPHRLSTVCVVHVHTFTGCRQTADDQTGNVIWKEEFSRDAAPQVYDTIVSDDRVVPMRVPTVPSVEAKPKTKVSSTQKKTEDSKDITVENMFKRGTEVVCMSSSTGHWRHYGAVAKVLSVSRNEAVKRLVPSTTAKVLVTIQLNEQKQPDVAPLRKLYLENSPSVCVQYYRVSEWAAYRSRYKDISPSVVGRITGDLRMTPPGLVKCSFFDKVLISLPMKNSKDDLKCPGYTWRIASEGGQKSWFYSQKAMDALVSYRQQFPEVFDVLQRSANENTGMNDLTADSVFSLLGPTRKSAAPDKLDDDQQHICKRFGELMKFHGKLVASIPGLVHNDASVLEEDVVEKIEEKLITVRADAISSKKAPSNFGLKIHVPPSQLLVPKGGQQTFVADPGVTFHVFDRVACVVTGHLVPFGATGTVIGVYAGEADLTSPDVAENKMIEVFFDEKFDGGKAIRCDHGRAARLFPHHLVNMTYGRMRKHGFTLPTRLQSNISFASAASREDKPTKKTDVKSTVPVANVEGTGKTAKAWKDMLDNSKKSTAKGKGENGANAKPSTSTTTAQKTNKSSGKDTKLSRLISTSVDNPDEIDSPAMPGLTKPNSNNNNSNDTCVNANNNQQRTTDEQPKKNVLQLFLKAISKPNFEFVPKAERLATIEAGLAPDQENIQPPTTEQLPPPPADFVNTTNNRSDTRLVEPPAFVMEGKVTANDIERDVEPPVQLINTNPDVLPLIPFTLAQSRRPIQPVSASSSHMAANIDATDSANQVQFINPQEVAPSTSYVMNQLPVMPATASSGNFPMQPMQPQGVRFPQQQNILASNGIRYTANGSGGNFAPPLQQPFQQYRQPFIPQQGVIRPQPMYNAPQLLQMEAYQQRQQQLQQMQILQYHLQQQQQLKNQQMQQLQHAIASASAPNAAVQSVGVPSSVPSSMPLPIVESSTSLAELEQLMSGAQMNGKDCPTVRPSASDEWKPNPFSSSFVPVSVKRNLAQVSVEPEPQPQMVPALSMTHSNIQLSGNNGGGDGGAPSPSVQLSATEAGRPKSAMRRKKVAAIL